MPRHGLTDRRARSGAPALLWRGASAGWNTARCVIAAAIALSAATVEAGAQLLVEPLEVVLMPGSNPTSSFTITNEGKTAVQASLAFEDWDRDDMGLNRFYAPGTQAGSCGRMVRVFPEAIRLEPRQSGVVRVMLVDADTARRACWSIVFVETREPPSQAQRQITFSLRTGVKIYIELPTLAREGSVEDMNFQPHLRYEDGGTRAVVDSTQKDAVVAFRNSGGVQLRAHGAMEIRRLDNSLVNKIDVDEIPVLPGARRLIRFPIPANLAPGRYVLLALLDYGGDELAAGQLEYEVR